MTNQHRSYDPQDIEKRWQAKWRESKAFAGDGSGEPFYILEMFPYPSGNLHMGHVRNYTIGDVFARFHKMQGRDVLHPMGWDSLGLPAENQAIKEKIAPQIRTPKNIKQMKEQMERLGLAYDWSREIATYRPDYYRWNQWFFVKLLEKDLVYRRQNTVNWCPGCNTVLANEQVLDDATCWRGHKGVTTRSIPEWAFRITSYAEELLADLDKLSAWPERIVSQQRHWIGKSFGARVEFPLQGSDKKVEVFTTRVDTIFGCTYVVLAPEHPLTDLIATDEQRGAVEAFVEKTRAIDAIERTAEGAPKEGVFTGATAKNPYTGEVVPVWIANFVLADYGTGAVMSVPAHDQRDFEFASKFDIPIKPVIHPSDGTDLPSPQCEAFTDDGVLRDSGEFSGLTSADAREKMSAFASTNGFGEATVNWHLRDWGFSRQRYWGTPIPIIYCDDHGAVPVPEEDLPVVLPDFDTIELTGEGGAPLGKLPSFYQTKCPTCGKTARREVDTMDTFVDSAWYFARFLSPELDTAPFDQEAAKRWLPVDVYVGGPEHAVMHLLYFRFWTKAMRDLGLLSIDEPVTRLITQGMVNAAAFSCPSHGYFPVSEMLAKPEGERNCPKCNEPLGVAIEKMSKSKYNGVDPMSLIERYGADTTRLYVLFAAPPEKDLEWNPDSVEGLSRFASRIFRVAQAQGDEVRTAELPKSMAGLKGADAEIRRALHRTLAKVTHEVGVRNHFNTAIAAMMELINTFYERKLHEGSALNPGVRREALLTLAQMLAPFAPHLAEEIWSLGGGEGLVAQSRWPEPDPEALERRTLNLVVQINGKLRAQLEVPVDADEDAIDAIAQADENVAKFLEGKIIRKRVFVPGRLVNYVVG
ncbi:MAG: leucine--tRNA ligase [Deltaproteobacteria bacterium RIFOXYA12_FULL_58_15]|nr:MAG: leucine--tRNA ligase [Deltaproteobacteria bacterium RIFOXYA12_FULL_58_15]OGR08447.1 MAG: leucine--tRNA ligase [Deltaproteobacteria bacterium RIFOXYB12_FULL_58_9]